MNTSTTLQYFNDALMSGQLIHRIQRINAERAIEFIPALTSDLQDIFIQNLCNFLNSSNLILTGGPNDIRIIANYICANVMDIPTTQQFVNLAYSSGYLLEKIIDIGGNAEWFTHTMCNIQLKTIFIQNFCNELNSRNMALTGEDNDMRIIAEYALADYIDSVVD